MYDVFGLLYGIRTTISNMIIERVNRKGKIHYDYYDERYLQVIDTGGLKLQLTIGRLINICGSRHKVLVASITEIQIDD